MLPETYLEVTQKTGIVRCRGIKENGQYCHEGNHQLGVVTGGPTPTVHWGDRRVTRAGLRRFLFLAAYARTPAYWPRWRRTYVALRDIPIYAAKIGVRIPRNLGDTDRAALKAMLVKVPRRTPVRDEAMEWLRR